LFSSSASRCAATFGASYAAFSRSSGVSPPPLAGGDRKGLPVSIGRVEGVSSGMAASGERGWGGLRRAAARSMEQRQQSSNEILWAALLLLPLPVA
jgi:hypothetical protein